MSTDAQQDPTDTSVTIVYNKCFNITIPSASEYFYKIGLDSLVFSIIAIILTTAMTMLYAIEMYYVFRYVSPYTQRAGKLIWMSGVQPLTAIGCLIAVCVPRALGIIEMFILLYFARCLFSITQLVVDFFGGRLEMARALQGTTVRLNTLPVCCCFVCIPRVQPTAKVIRRIEWLVYQAAIIRPVGYIITGTVSADLAGNAPVESSVTTASNIVNVVSTLMAMYGFLLIANMTDIPLKPYCTKALMKLTQLTIVLYNIQGAIFQVLAQQGVISCSDILPAVSRAAEWHFLLLIVESFFISMGAAFFLRPSVNATFDLYPTHLQKQANALRPKAWRYERGDQGDPSSKALTQDFPKGFSDDELLRSHLPMGIVAEGQDASQGPGKVKSEDPLFRYPKVDVREKVERGRSASATAQSFQNSEPVGITV